MRLWPPADPDSRNAVVVNVLVVLVAGPTGWPGTTISCGSHVKTRLPLAYQILVFQVAIILLSALIGAAAAVWQASQELDRQSEQRSLAIAQAVAENVSLQPALLGGGSPHFSPVTAGSVRPSP